MLGNVNVNIVKETHHLCMVAQSYAGVAARPSDCFCGQAGQARALEELVHRGPRRLVAAERQVDGRGRLVDEAFLVTADSMLGLSPRQRALELLVGCYLVKVLPHCRAPSGAHQLVDL